MCLEDEWHEIFLIMTENLNMLYSCAGKMGSSILTILNAIVRQAFAQYFM